MQNPVTLLFLLATLLLSLKPEGCSHKNKHKPVVTSTACDTIPPHLDDNLWAYYPVHGSVADESGHGHKLSLMGGAALDYDQWGNDSEAINFDGTNGYGIIADGTRFPASDFSISMVVMLRESSGLFFGKQNYADAWGASFNIGIDPILDGPVPRFSITLNQEDICSDEARGGLFAENDRPFYPYAWYHVAATFSNGLMKLYVNGRLVSSRTIPYRHITVCSKAQFVLADWWAGGHNRMNGKMDELRIYTRALTEEEINYLYRKR